MKRIIVLFLALCCILGLLSGCSTDDNSKGDNDTNTTSKITATIVTNSGETKQMTFDEIREVEETNTILFDDEYIGADITVTSKITKIGGRYSATSWFDCDAYLELESGNFMGCYFKPITEDEARNYSVGETVTVSGKIGMASVAYSDIYIMATEISPY